MKAGTLTELDPIDGLGWIDLDDGTRVRVGGTALSPLRPIPTIGTRLNVLEVEEGYRGVLKATKLTLLDPPPSPKAVVPAEEPARIAWAALIEQYPRWSDAAEVGVVPTLSAPPLSLPPHPLFAPWHREIAETSPVCVPLGVPHHSQLDPIEPTPRGTFALGSVAFLDRPEWPACGRCAQPMEMCIQIGPDVGDAFGAAGRSLVALFCFACGTMHRDDPRVGHVAWVEPLHRVERGANTTASSRPACGTQRVAVAPPVRVLPGTMWHRDRSGIRDDTASSVLLGFDARAIEGPYDDAVAAWIGETDYELPLHPEDVELELENWLAVAPGVVRGAGAHWGALGGAPLWDQADATPTCHGPMLLLLDHDGGQFLDGALHVFTCGECEALRLVPEF